MVLSLYVCDRLTFPVMLHMSVCALNYNQSKTLQLKHLLNMEPLGVQASYWWRDLVGTSVLFISSCEYYDTSVVEMRQMSLICQIVFMLQSLSQSMSPFSVFLCGKGHLIMNSREEKERQVFLVLFLSHDEMWQNNPTVWEVSQEV